MPSPTTPLVDHIVILIPHSFLTAPPPWFAALFHFYPGGRHADGLTENTLVLLADGSYLEFIAFVPGVDPARRAAHQWGKKAEGTVVDWAVTLPLAQESGVEEVQGGELRQEKAFREIQHRVRAANTGFVYGDLVRGGRTRPDGVVLKWAVAFPKDAGDDGGPVEPGTVPFWCLDVTARELRVPYTPAFGRHPTGVVGVASVHVRLGGEGSVGSARGVYDVLLEGKKATGEWKLDAPRSSGAVVTLDGGDGASRVDIAFFTDDPSLVGKEVGGKVDDDHELKFRLVAAP
ncbi:glyoxalase-like domain-containing protein [Hypomontagnella submonticulosa]|nr:glyoxalase-like domain-containing protein [Hypomontagnella submonticulosa]